MYELYVYTKDKKNKPIEKSNQLNKYSYGVFEPSFYKMWLKGSTYKQWLKNVYWFIITRSHYKIYYVYDKAKLIHTSYCIQKCYKFPFMEDADIQIGPCNTNTDYRGEGIYPYVLASIVSDYEKNACNIYMIIKDENTSSKRGALKAGFKKINRLCKNNLFKTYKILIK